MTKTIRLPVHYYKQHDADVGAEHPGKGFSGWAVREIDVPLDKSALVSMHVWNIGLDERIPYGPNSPYVGWFRVVEYLPRAMSITKEVFPDLLGAARSAGLTVMHVASQESYVAGFKEYQRIKKLAGPSEKTAGAVNDPLRGEWIDDRNRHKRGAHNAADVREGGKHIDFAPQAIPEDGEPVVIDSHQLNVACRERGIWHLIYVGFAVNWCLLMSPGCMMDMHRLGYVCSTIRQATTAVENRETCERELAKEIGLWRVAMMFGHVFDLSPFVSALKDVASDD